MSTVLELAPHVQPPQALPSPASLGRATVGLALLGLCCGLGSGELAMASRALPTGLAAGGGALVLTGPALLVAHQYLRLQAKPEAILGALAEGWVRAGSAALGMVPVALFFSASSRLWGGVLALSLLGIGGLGVAATVLALRAAEAREHEEGTARMTSLALGWAGLAGLISLRIAWDLATFILWG